MSLGSLVRVKLYPSDWSAGIVLSVLPIGKVKVLWSCPTGTQIAMCSYDSLEVVR